MESKRGRNRLRWTRRALHFRYFHVSVTDKLDIKRLTQDMGNNESLRGRRRKHIVFASDRSGESKLYIMNADGSNQRKLHGKRRIRHSRVVS
jgi:hypothetical protein